MKKEEFEKLVNDVRDKLDETQRALVSEDFLNIMSAYNTTFDEMDRDKYEFPKLN